MPLYECECKKCGTFEVFESRCVEVQARPCPKCGRAAPRVWKNGTGRPEPFTPYYTNALSLRTEYVDSRATEKKWEKEKGFVRVK